MRLLKPYSGWRRGLLTGHLKWISSSRERWSYSTLSFLTCLHSLVNLPLFEVDRITYETQSVMISFTVVIFFFTTDYHTNQSATGARRLWYLCFCDSISSGPKLLLVWSNGRIGRPAMYSFLETISTDISSITFANDCLQWDSLTATFDKAFLRTWEGQRALVWTRLST